MTEHNAVHYYKLSLGCYLQSVVVEVFCNLIDMFSYFQVVTSGVQKWICSVCRRPQLPCSMS